MRTVLLAVALLVLSVLAAGQSFTRVPVLAQEPATAAVQKLLDEHDAKLADAKQTITALAASVEALESLQPTNPAIVTATSLGCKPDDGVDDAPALQKALDTGRGIQFDASGFYELGAPLRTKPGSASPLLGGSGSWRGSPACRTGLKPLGSAVTHLIEVTGDATAGAGPSQAIRDLHFLGLPTCDGIRVHGGYVVAIEGCSFRQCKRGILIEPTPRCYSPRLASCQFSQCDTGIELQNGESVCCFTAIGCYASAGRLGFFVNGWRRGAAFIGCVSEGQTSRSWLVRDGRVTLVSCYGENVDEIPGLEMKNSTATIVDTTIRRYKHDSSSQITTVGENALTGTLSY